MTKLKVAVISSCVFPCPPKGYAGLEMITWLTAKGLAEKGHEVSLIAPEGSSCPGAEIIPTGIPGQFDEAGAYNSYWKYLPTFDCIIDSSWCKYAYLLKQEGRLKAPVLGVMHAPVNTMYQSLPEVEKPCFVCISQDQCNHFNALFSPVTARVCYNGLDVDFYRPLNIPKTDRFLFLARFSHIKGPRISQQVCIDADVPLDMVGDTSITNEPELLQDCINHADGEKIKIVGGVSRGETVWYFNRARGMLHLTKHFREPFGLAPLECQLTGTPVVAWKYGSIPEIIKDGETGYLVSSEKEAVEVVKAMKVDPFFKGGSPERCREFASQFSTQRMTDRYESLCHEAMEGGW